jgi:hypothetical protein
MNYTLSRDAMGRFCDLTQRERDLVSFSLCGTRAKVSGIESVSLSDVARQQLLFIPQYNDTTIAERYAAKVTATKSLCITMGFCITNRYAWELSVMPRRVGEWL